VRRPTKYSRKLPFKTGKSEYDSTFSQSLQQKDLTDSTPHRSKIGYLMKMPDKSITNYQSTYEVFLMKDRWTTLNANRKHY
jgi:hypothetical protein